jgi:hypothetical protein
VKTVDADSPVYDNSAFLDDASRTDDDRTRDGEYSRFRMDYGA